MSSVFTQLWLRSGVSRTSGELRVTRGMRILSNTSSPSLIAKTTSIIQAWPRVYPYSSWIFARLGLDWSRLSVAQWQFGAGPYHGRSLLDCRLVNKRPPCSNFAPKVCVLGPRKWRRSERSEEICGLAGTGRGPEKVQMRGSTLRAAKLCRRVCSAWLPEFS